MTVNTIIVLTDIHYIYILILLVVGIFQNNMFDVSWVSCALCSMMAPTLAIRFRVCFLSLVPFGAPRFCAPIQLAALTTLLANWDPQPV